MLNTLNSHSAANKHFIGPTFSESDNKLIVLQKTKLCSYNSIKVHSK